MNRRKLFLALAAIAAAPWKYFTRSRCGYKKLFTQAFPTPKNPEELIGIFVVFPDQVFPHQIIREFDEWNETWEGQALRNPWRNKWWAKNVSGKEELIIVHPMRDPDGVFRYDHSLLFFRKV